MSGGERTALTERTLIENDLDALVCTLPANVLLLTGYWPVVGTSVALAARDGRTLVIAPEDELNLARNGWAEVMPFRPSSLDTLANAVEAVREPLRRALENLGLAHEHSRLGHEGGGLAEPASYSAMLVYGAAIVDLLGAAAPGASIVAACHALRHLRARKTSADLKQIRAACAVAARGFLHGAEQLRPSLTESQAAALFQAPLSIEGIGRDHIERAGGFVYCMSGRNAAQAYCAYARTRQRPLLAGDLVLVHCNSYADGYWTDIARTYCMGEPDSHKQDLYDAVFAARMAALNTIRPGARGSEVDEAARAEFRRRGFADLFKHSTGHGVGFGAIDHDARPRLHLKSEDVLEPGMVMNVEPAVYIDGFGGIRHCDMVAVTEDGMELLTPFHSNLRQLVIAA